MAKTIKVKFVPKGTGKSTGKTVKFTPKKSTPNPRRSKGGRYA